MADAAHDYDKHNFKVESPTYIALSEQTKANVCNRLRDIKKQPGKKHRAEDVFKEVRELIRSKQS